MPSQSVAVAADVPPDPVTTSELFRAFPAELHSTLLSALDVIHVPAGAPLFQQGDPGDGMYLVRRGLVHITLRTEDGSDQVIDVHGPGSSVGELALITGKPRSAAAVTQGAAELLRLSRSAFEALAAQHPDAIRRYAETLLPRLRRAHVAGVLISLFGQLSVRALEDLIAALEWRSLSSGATLFRQGDPGDYVAIVVTGRLRVEVSDPTGATRTVTELGRGQYVGELAVLTGEPRSATISAVRDADLALLHKDAFDRLIAQHPDVMMRLTRVLIERLRTTTRAPTPALKPLSLALVPLAPGTPLDGLAEQLAAALAAIGPTMHLDSRRLEQAFGRADLDHADEQHPLNVTLRGWLSDRELEHRFMLFVADPQPTAWTLRCLRQADVCVLLGAAHAPPTLSANEAAIAHLGLKARRVLVLVHPAWAAHPRNTGAWLARRTVDAHYHVREGSPADAQRLANLLTGRGVGIVLSGGGARGFAHVGVLRALDEAGIVVDAIGGVSAGALIAGAYAQGRDWQAIDALARELLHKWRVPDYTLPLVSLLRGGKLTADVRKLFGETQIEDLWRSFFCLSVNLTRLSVVVHERGPLWRSVRSSASLPLVFPPLLERGEVLVDGGVINNLPADVMRRLMPDGQIIAVDVSMEQAMLPDYRFGPSLSGWNVLLGRFMRPERRLSAPSFVDILMRVLEISAVSSRYANSGYANLLLRPPVEHFGTLAFGAYDEIVEAGYRSAQEQLAAWRA
jgi:NTE family protein/lysophospholipid hydrolase